MANLDWTETAPWNWVALTDDGSFQVSMCGGAFFADFHRYGDNGPDDYVGKFADLGAAYDACQRAHAFSHVEE